MALVLGGTLLTAAAPSLGVMALARALAGLGYGTTAVVGILYLMRSATPGQRARRGNMYEGALITANAVSGYLAGRIAVFHFHAQLAGLRQRGQRGRVGTRAAGLVQCQRALLEQHGLDAPAFVMAAIVETVVLVGRQAHRLRADTHGSRRHRSP